MNDKTLTLTISYTNLYISKIFVAEESKILNALKGDFGEVLPEWKEALNLSGSKTYRFDEINLKYGIKKIVIKGKILSVISRADEKNDDESLLHEKLRELFNYFFPVIGSLYDVNADIRYFMGENIVRVNMKIMAVFKYVNFWDQPIMVNCVGALYVDLASISHTMLYYMLLIISKRKHMIIAIRDQCRIDDYEITSLAELLNFYFKLNIEHSVERRNNLGFDLTKIY